MPRKKNGIGTLGTFSSNSIRSANSKTNVSGVKKAAGLYPSDRRFGTLTQRTVIESYDLNSRWVRWRKGFEFYSKALYSSFQTLVTKMYQGQPDSWEVEFTGYKFPTMNADSNTHYVAKKTLAEGESVLLGKVSKVYSDPITDSANRANNEIWVDMKSPYRILNRMTLDRLTDGATEATLKFVLNGFGHPSVYLAKPLDSMPEPWQPRMGVNVDPILFISVPLAEIQVTDFMQRNNGDLQALVGQLGYLPSAMEVSANTGLEDQLDAADEFYVHLFHTDESQDFQILENDGALPDSLYDIAELDKVFDTKNANFGVDVVMGCPKAPYQRFFGSQYLTADLALSGVDTASYGLPPFRIKSVRQSIRWELGSNGIIELIDVVLLEADPFRTELYLEETYKKGGSATLILTDYSFTRRTTLPTDPFTTKGFAFSLDTDVDPWMDETFMAGGELRPAEMYTCSCPDYAKAQLRMPGGQKQGGKKRNRQERYPLPSALSRQDIEAVGLNSVAGITQGWGTYKDRSDFHFCKHTAAAMFIDRIKLKEPNDYPSLDSREKFDAAMEEEFEKLDEAFDIQVKRSEITTTEIIFALAQGLNLDEIEMANLLIETKF